MQQEILENVAEQMLAAQEHQTPPPTVAELVRLNRVAGFRVTLEGEGEPVTVCLLPDGFYQARQRFLDLFEGQPFSEPDDEGGPDGRGAEPREWD